MTILRFTDGVQIDTGGPIRAALKEDGWYVLGHGLCMACETMMEARNMAGHMRVDQLRAISEYAVGVVVAALNACDWTKIDPDNPGPGVVATETNLHGFRRKAMIEALNQFKPAITPDYMPVLERILHILTEGK